MRPLIDIRQLPSAPRIVIRGVNWLGDAVMTTPALIRLREQFPAAHIALLTPKKLADLWISHLSINETIPVAPGEGLFSVSGKLRSGKFDLALVFPNSPRSAIEPWLAGIPRRIGYARRWRNRFLTQAVPPRAEAVKMQKRSATEIRYLVAADVNRRVTPNRRAFRSAATNSHQIHEYLHLAGMLGANAQAVAPQLSILPEEPETIKMKFGLERIVQPIFSMNPGAEYGPAKRWPVERFIAAAREIQKQTNCIWLIFGGEKDAPIANQIESGIHPSPFAIQNLAGRTSLRELMSLLKLCGVLLTNDSGPMHVAAALGTPVVAPFGSTSPELTGPGLPGDARHHLLTSQAPCSPCFLRKCPIDFRCMNDITVESVVEAVLKTTLNRNQGPAPG